MARVNAAIIGMGLMGGSIARALKDNPRYRITAFDADETVLQSARDEGLAAGYTRDARTAVGDADLVVVCLYPQKTVEFILQNMAHFKSGAVVTDICGVKRYVCDAVSPRMRRDVAFVPAHPMAGREKKGFAMSDGELFTGCNYLVLPEGADGEAVRLVEALAADLGAGKVVYTDPQKHDEYVAYTSQLPHAISCAYVQRRDGRPVAGHAAGSLKDVSRVADINAAMWAELFIRNADRFGRECEALAAGLLHIARLAGEKDADALAAYLQACADDMEKSNEKS